MGHTLGTTEPGERKTPPRGAPSLVVAFECDRPLTLPSRHSLANTDLVLLGRGKAREIARTPGATERTLTISVPDRRMSAAHARLTSALERWVLEDAGSRNGTRVNGNPISRHVLCDGDLVELGHSFFLYQENVVTTEPDQPASPGPQPGMSTLSPSLSGDFARLEQLSGASVSILFLGASGTGKELLARAVHEMSGRSGPFIGVNCGAIPDSLVESEFFGHTKGAFSGAVSDHLGLIRSADQGTLFLDEIGDLPAASQAKLLRVLQEREVRPLGTSQTIPVDLRVICATHQDLQRKIQLGEFREDLFARISGFTVTLPPLGSRREDLALLIAELLKRIVPNSADLVSFEIDAGRELWNYPWPRNIRELENCLATATVLAKDGPIALEHLPASIREPMLPPDAGVGAGLPPLTGEQKAQRAELEQLLREHRGNVSAVARSLSKDRKQIQRWIKRYDLDLDVFRRRES